MPHHHDCQRVNRRAFIHGLGYAAAGLALASCSQGNPLPEPTIVPAPTLPVVSKPTVAIAKAENYEPKLVRSQVQALLDGIGGIEDILAHGNRVAIKVNLTGGTSSKPLPGTTEIETYLTHPEVVKALCELLHDSGVKDIFILESVYEQASWPHYGYTEMAKSVGATLIDLNYPNPYIGYVHVSPGSKGMEYEDFIFNPLLHEIDAFISVSKMKCHNTAGVTHSMKNLFGLVPVDMYKLGVSDTYRSAFHGFGDTAVKRLPKIIVDLNLARPVHLALIDGIMTTEGGEGPWIQGLNPIKPGVLLAGKDPVATDAVATAAMGFDPTAEYPDAPFVNAHNHLNIAARLGLGTNKLEDIEVVGEKIADVTMPFKVSE
ncbi:MAG: DUF362 domain-containing protein [Chloroflexi bacterium]|nr:MAG: DUF362 domain-containing protein [Chloroflexota bacterium]